MLSIPRHRRCDGLPVTGIQEIAGHVVFAGGKLPLELGRQPGAGPAREGVRLVIADVGYGCVGVELAKAAQRELGLEAFVPVQGPGPPSRVDGRPTIRQPEV